MKGTFAVLFCFLLIFSKVYAFDWEKCGKALPGGKASIIGMPLSTTSFFSSTGDCAMIGMREHDKKVFIAQNLDQLKLESALGHGEYLANYSAMIGCSENASGEFFKSLKNNFIKVFGKEIKLSPKQVHKNIERLMRSDTILSSKCRNDS